MADRNFKDYELDRLERLTDELIMWMFNKPNDRYVILKTLKQAFELGFSAKQVIKSKRGVKE